MQRQKGYGGEDIHEGKLTLMVLHHLAHGSEQSKARLLSILRMKSEDQAVIAEAIGLLRETKSIDYARQRMHELVAEAERELDSRF